jgi:hypothetical protein
MTRVFENRRLSRTTNISIIVMVVVIVFGCFDLWNAFVVGSDDTTAALFGAVFVGGGLLGINTLWIEGRDQAQWFDVDFDAGKGVVAVWRPFRPLVIEAGLDKLTDWRHWVKVGKRNAQTHFIVAAVPGYPRPVYFELPPGRDIPEAFRRLAPEAVDDYEVNSGRRKAEA